MNPKFVGPSQVYFPLLSVALRKKKNNHITHYSFIQLFDSTNMNILYAYYMLYINKTVSLSIRGNKMYVQIPTIEGERWCVLLPNISNWKKRRLSFISTVLVQVTYVLWCTSIKILLGQKLSSLFTLEPEYQKPLWVRISYFFFWGSIFLGIILKITPGRILQVAALKKYEERKSLIITESMPWNEKCIKKLMRAHATK